MWGCNPRIFTVAYSHTRHFSKSGVPQHLQYIHPHDGDNIKAKQSKAKQSLYVAAVVIQSHLCLCAKQAL